MGGLMIGGRRDGLELGIVVSSPTDAQTLKTQTLKTQTLRHSRLKHSTLKTQTFKDQEEKLKTLT